VPLGRLPYNPEARIDSETPERPHMDDPHFGGYPYSPYISCERHSVGGTATNYTVLPQLLL